MSNSPVRPRANRAPQIKLSRAELIIATLAACDALPPTLGEYTLGDWQVALVVLQRAGVLPKRAVNPEPLVFAALNKILTTPRTVRKGETLPSRELLVHSSDGLKSALSSDDSALE